MDSHPPFTAQERTECRAFGTIPNSDLQSLQDLLLGCSGSQGLPFKHHEVVLKNDAKPPVVVYLVQALHEGESKQSPQSSSNSSRVIRECKRWTVRRETVNTRGAIKDLAVSVRLVNEVPMMGTDVIGFWTALGFQHERESLRSGMHFTVNTSSLPVKVGIYRLQKLEERGNVSSAADISPGYSLVEAVCTIDSSNPTAGAQSIGKLQEGLGPLLSLQKG